MLSWVAMAAMTGPRPGEGLQVIQLVEAAFLARHDPAGQVGGIRPGRAGRGRRDGGGGDRRLQLGRGPRGRGRRGADIHAAAPPARGRGRPLPPGRSRRLPSRGAPGMAVHLGLAFGQLPGRPGLQPALLRGQLRVLPRPLRLSLLAAGPGFGLQLRLAPPRRRASLPAVRFQGRPGRGPAGQRVGGIAAAAGQGVLSRVGGGGLLDPRPPPRPPAAPPAPRSPARAAPRSRSRPSTRSP